MRDIMLVKGLNFNRDGNDREGGGAGASTHTRRDEFFCHKKLVHKPFEIAI